MTDVLQVEHLSKSFGKTTVITDISLSVPAGSVFGFIGENGAGKTTTMKMILGLLKPDSGSVHVCGEKVRFGMTKSNRYVGYLPDVPQFYSYFRPQEYLRLCGQIAGMSTSQIARRSTELLEMVGLAKVTKRIGSFSRGMRQRLGVAQALIHSPRLLICDEPTSALDPVGRKEVLDLLHQISADTTVLFSTHVLSDVERICDRAAVLHHGTIVLDGNLADLKARHGSTGLQIEFSHPDDLARFRSLVPARLLADQTDTEVTVRTTDPKADMAILHLLAEHDILPVRFEALAPSVENLFLEAVA
ncbi:MAG: ABC transporter ATP-binding protein [Propionibacteriaceae bacterium]|nr:ABC transporter ATP-binding protein [Propionibacteriaceae bacterium]